MGLNRESRRQEFQGSQTSSICHAVGQRLSMPFKGESLLPSRLQEQRKNTKCFKLVENTKYSKFVIIRVSKLFALSVESWLNGPR